MKSIHQESINQQEKIANFQLGLLSDYSFRSMIHVKPLKGPSITFTFSPSDEWKTFERVD